MRGQDLDRFADASLRSPAVLLFIIDLANKAGIPATLLMDAYGLTQAEARVALAVASGLSIPETGRALALSPNTIKTQLRGVFAKSGLGWQSELARLIASIGLFRAGNAGAASPESRRRSFSPPAAAAPLPSGPGSAAPCPPAPRAR